MVLGKTLKSPLDYKEIRLVTPKGNQPWIFIGMTDAEAELQYFGHLMRRANSLKKTDAGKDWGNEDKGAAEDEMVGWHHGLNGHEVSEWSEWSRSVVSDSLQSHGLYPTRLLHPWNFLGKSTGVGRHFLHCHLFLCMLGPWFLIPSTLEPLLLELGVLWQTLPVLHILLAHSGSPAALMHSYYIYQWLPVLRINVCLSLLDMMFT